MKNIFNILCLIGICALNAQEINNKLDIPEGYTVSDYGFTDEGSLYIKTNKRVLSAKAKDATFKKYNSKTLELDLTHKPTEQFRIRKSSPNGETFLYDNSGSFAWNSEEPSSILHADGTVKNFEEKDWTPEDFIMISDFINKDFYVAIGYEKGREKFKGKKKNKDYKLFRRDLNTFQSYYTDFDLTRDVVIDEEEKKFEHQFLEHSDENFTLITKNYLMKDDKGNHPKKVDYVLSIYDYEGKLKETRTLTNEIEDKRLKFKSTNMGPGSYRYEYKTYTSMKGGMKTTTITIPQHISFGNVHNDIENQVYYTYGIINGGNKTKNKCVFMLDKFDYSGTKIWSKSYNQPTRNKKGQGFENFVTKVKLVDTGNTLGVTLADMGNDYLSVVQINKSDGEIISTEGFGDFKRNGLNGFMNFDNMYTNEFVSDYVFKDRFGKKMILDFDTLIAYSLNPEFKNFIDSKTSTEIKLNIITNITSNGIITILADNKDNNFNLMKFNWDNQKVPEANSK